MGRRPKHRASFYEDAQYLLRMGQAIVNDVSLPEPWRRDMDARIKELAGDLLKAPSRHLIQTGASRNSDAVPEAVEPEETPSPKPA